MIMLFMGSFLSRETRHTVGFSKEIFFFSNGKTQGTKTLLEFSEINYDPFQLPFLDQIQENHHELSHKHTSRTPSPPLSLPLLDIAHPLKHPRPEPAAACRILASPEGIGFWCGVCQEGQDSAQPQPGAGEGGSACGPLTWLQTTFLPGAPGYQGILCPWHPWMLFPTMYLPWLEE